jgi:hypothetical protein
MEDNSTYTITGGPLNPGEYVVIKAEMTAADEAWIQNHSAKMLGKGRKAKVHVTIGDVKLATLKRMITGWRLTRTIKDHEGNERQIDIPFSTEAIDNLPQRISGYINKRVDDLNPDWEEDEDEEDF